MMRAVALAVLAALATVAAACAQPLGAPEVTSTAAVPTLAPSPVPTPTPSLPPNPQGLRRWTDLPVTYCISDPAGGYVPPEQFVALVERSFARWGVPAERVEPCPSDGSGNEVGWGALATDGLPPGAFEAGLTETRYEECTAGCPRDDAIRITGATITIDADPPPSFQSEACLESTLLHEVGHFLGLDHVDPGVPAVMSAEVGAGCPTTLAEADIAALRARYGQAAQPG